MKDSANISDPPSTLSYDGFTFTIDKKIGEGGFARCYEVTEASSTRKFAVKAIHVEAITRLRAKNKLLNELHIHYRLDHRHIVKLYKVFQDNQYIYMILELCENKTMVELLRSRKHLSEPEVRHYLWMVLLALNYLHERNIIHRDLKLSNIFLNLEYDVKIGDFGLATTLDQIGDRKKTICGTPNYIAPEILFDKERGHSFEVDVWAFGVIMYSLLFGRPPFQNSDVKVIYKNIKENAYTFPERLSVSNTAKELISLILTPDPDKRPKLDAIAGHPFFMHVLIKEPTRAEISAIKIHCYSVPLGTSTCTTGLSLASTVSSRSKENYPPANDTPTQMHGMSSKSTPTKEKRISIVEVIYRSLCLFLSQKLEASVLLSPSSSVVAAPSFYIEKWIDYTNKYGMGYKTSNGHIGAYFNDSTSIILDPYTNTFEYQYQEAVSPDMHRQIIRQQYHLDDYPPTLNKKVTIIRHFQSYLGKLSSSLENRNSQKPIAMDCLVKYAIVKDVLVFRLSNRVIQTVFPDHIMLIISQEGQVVTVVNELTRVLQSYALLHIVDRSIVHKLEQLLTILESLLGLSPAVKSMIS